jgi:hypothetical protein
MIVSLSTSIVIAASVIVRDRRKLWFLQAIATEHGIEHLATAAAAVQTALGGSALTSQLAQQPWTSCARIRRGDAVRGPLVVAVKSAPDSPANTSPRRITGFWPAYIAPICFGKPANPPHFLGMCEAVGKVPSQVIR